MDLWGLAALIVDAGVAPQASVDAILKHPSSVATGELQTLAIENEEALAEVLAGRAQRPALIFATSVIDLDAVGLLPPSTCRDLLVLPVLVRDGVVTVAIAAEATVPLDRLGAALGMRVEPVVALPFLLEVAIDRAFARRQAGEAILPGARALRDDDGGSEPTLRCASPPMKARLPRPDSVARMLNEVLLDEALTTPSGSKSAPLATLKLKRVARPQGGEGEPAPSPSTPPIPVPIPPRRPTILVVEDDFAIRTLLATLLRRDGYEVVEVVSGDQVGPALREQRPDLILLDAMLPAVHGFEICGALKSSPTWAQVPVVMMSAVYRGFEHARTIQEVHRADRFIEKPFQSEHVRAVCAELLQRASPVPAGMSLGADRAWAKLDHALTIDDVPLADAVLRDWLEREPLSAQAWLEWGHLALRRGEPGEALRAYELATSYQPRHYQAQLSLAALYERLGFERRSRETWRRAAGVAPTPALADRIMKALAALELADKDR